MRKPVYVIFDHPLHAEHANQALLEADDIEPPVRQSIVEAPVGQGHVPWQDSRALAGAVSGGITTGLLVAFILVLATATGVLAISFPTAALVGVVTGGIYGIMLGALAGVTEPTEPLRRLRRRLLPGQAAVAATFADREEAQRAEALLLDCPGATSVV